MAQHPDDVAVGTPGAVSRLRRPRAAPARHGPGGSLLPAASHASPSDTDRPAWCGARAWSQSPVATCLGLLVLAAAAALVTGRALAVARDPAPVLHWKLAQYWLDYEFGFVRRALPGELLSRVTGGPPGSVALVQAVGTGLTVAAALAVVPLALRFAGRARGTATRLLVVATLLVSPLTVALLLHDLGRYDGVGVLVLAALVVASGWRRLPTWAGTGLVAVLLAGATATEEFLVALLAPAALARTALLAGTAERSRAWIHPAVAVGPAVAVAAASLLVPPPGQALAVARQRAEAAGVGPLRGWGDALSAVDRGLTENVGFFDLFGAAEVIGTLMLWATVWASTVALLTRLLGTTRDRWWWALVVWFAAVALALSAVGVDFRRWFGLALLGLVAAATLVRPEPAREPQALPPGPGALSAFILLAVLGVRTADLPVVPVAPAVLLASSCAGGC